MSATKQDIENLQQQIVNNLNNLENNIVNVQNNLQSNQINNFNNVESNLNNLQKELNNNNENIETLFSRLYDNNNNIDSNDKTSGIYTNWFFRDNPCVIIRNVKTSMDLNKDIYDLYNIRNYSKTFNLVTSFELITDENGIRTFTIFGFNFVFINDDTAITTNPSQYYFFSKIASPNVEIGKFLDQVRNIYLNDNVLTKLQINSDLAEKDKWDETLTILNGNNVLETEAENILTGEIRKCNEKKYTRTDLLSIADNLFYNDESIEYSIENIKPTITYDECEGRLIQVQLGLTYDYLDIMTLSNYSKVTFDNLTINGTSDDGLYEQFQYIVSGFDRCSSQQYKLYNTSNRIQLIVPLYVSQESTMTLKFEPIQIEETDINDICTITIPSGLYYPQDLTTIINTAIRKVTNYSVRMDLIANKNIVYREDLTEDNITNSNLCYYIMSQTLNRGIQIAKSVTISNITGDTSTLFNITEGNYIFGEIEDTRNYTRNLVVANGVKLGDNPTLFTSIYGSTFTFDNTTKLIHNRSKISGSGNPRVFLDNLYIYTSYSKIEHHNLIIQKSPPSGFGELLNIDNWYDFNLLVTREHIANENMTFNGPTDGEFLSNTYRGNPTDFNGFESFYTYFGGGISVTGQGSYKSINGLIGASKTNTIYTNDLDSFTKNYLEEALRIVYDSNLNPIFKPKLTYVENPELTAPILGGSFVGIFKNSKIPTELQNNGDIVGILSVSSFIYNISSKYFIETVIDYFNSKNVTKIIVDLGTNPGGNTSTYISLFPGELKTNIDTSYINGYNATNKTGKKLEITLVEFIEWYSNLDQETKAKYDPYLLNKYNIDITSTWVNNNDVRFALLEQLDKSLNSNVTKVVNFLNTRSYSAPQSSTSIAKSIQLNNTIPFSYSLIGRINKVFGTSGGNFPNVTTGEIFENIEVKPDVRNEALMNIYGENRIELDDYISYYNTLDNFQTLTNGSYEEYLKDVGLLLDKSVDFNDPTTYLCNEMEYCLTQLV